jgi:hypothetical protein
MSDILHKSMVKAIKKEGETIQTSNTKGVSLRWAGARRAFLEVFTDAFECGDWRIAYSEILAAELLIFPYYLTSAYLLSVQTKSGLYQFGLAPSKFWKGQLPFPATKVKTKDSKFIAINIFRFIVTIWILIFPPVGIPFLLYVIWLHFRK